MGHQLAHGGLEIVVPHHTAGDAGGTRRNPRLFKNDDPAFDQTNSINIISDNAIDTALAADDTLEMMGPFVDTQAGVTTITTRKIMYLPARYVALLIGRVLTPRQAWDELGGAIRSEPTQIQLDLAPLMNWLKAALIKFDATDIPAESARSAAARERS